MILSIAAMYRRGGDNRSLCVSEKEGRNMVARKALVVIVAIVLVLVALGVGYVLLTQNPPGPPSGAAPAVTFASPPAAATGVAVNTKVLARFSQAMDPATISTSTFTLKQGTTAVSGTVAYAGTTATFAPAGNLAASTAFTATITTGAKDSSGQALAANFAWSFTTGTVPDTTRPLVSFTSPPSGATSVAVNTMVLATFSEVMDPSTITASTFTVMQGTTSVSGAVTYAVRTTTLNPASDLAASTVYTATITTGAKDLAGNALAANFVWSFTTGAVPDTTPPRVASTFPADSATGVAINADVLATFSEAMDPLTITTSTFTLMQGTTSVSGTVTYAGLTATFNPASDLTATAAYTGTITTGAKDLASNALAVNFVWSFTTGSTGQNGPAPVVLGTAGNFVILAKSSISTTGTTSITGDLGLSPAATSFITGFSLTMDPSNVFATSSLVTGRIYASDMAPPTPTTMTTAVLDMQNAFTDAAGRTLPDFTELGAGNIDGLTLVPGLYKWGTGVTFANGVTISGGANDVWIFQIAQDLTVGNGAIVTLSGGAQAKNIFWQVSGQVTLGTTSDFKGIILCQTQISMQTGASLLGRALAQTAVTLDANAVTRP